jgi:hypothetical protein
MAVTESPKTPAKADEPKPAKAGPLGRASESGDPAVQHLLAERQTAQMNREALQATDEDAVKKLNEDIKAADARIDELNKQLADLGYE